jgi:hypothetical protein
VNEYFFRKTAQNALVADDDEASKRLAKVKVGQVIRVNFRAARNLKFLQKWFALLSYAYEQLEYDEQLITFEDFRHQVTMLAGYRRQVLSIVTGETRWEPKSVSFQAMTQEDFDDLYSKTIDVLLKYVLKNYTRDDIDRVMSGISEYA